MSHIEKIAGGKGQVQDPEAILSMGNILDNEANVTKPSSQLIYANLYSNRKDMLSPVNIKNQDAAQRKRHQKIGNIYYFNGLYLNLTKI